MEANRRTGKTPVLDLDLVLRTTEKGRVRPPTLHPGRDPVAQPCPSLYLACLSKGEVELLLPSSFLPEGGKETEHTLEEWWEYSAASSRVSAPAVQEQSFSSFSDAE